MTKNGKSIQASVAFTVFLLSGTMIFSPLHRSANIFITLITAFITGILCTSIALRISSKKDFDSYFSKPKLLIFGFLSSLLSTASCLIMLTETIKDVSFIANRGISFIYYSFIAISILSVSYYLSCNTQKGIFRFCIPAAIPFLILFSVIFFSFSEAGIYIKNLKFGTDSSTIISSFFCGITMGLFFFSDTFIFIYCFKDCISFNSGKIMKKSIYTGFIVAMLALSLYGTVTFLVFGRNLTNTLSDPDYALIKLIPGLDMTELISALRIIAFIIKSSVYIFSSSNLLSRLFEKQKKANTIICAVLYGAIPPIFVAAYFSAKSLGYGAFQDLIYPLTTTLGTLYLFIISAFKKNID